MLSVPHIDISVYQLELTHMQQSTRVSNAKSSIQKKLCTKESSVLKENHLYGLQKKNPMPRTKCLKLSRSSLSI